MAPEKHMDREKECTSSVYGGAVAAGSSAQRTAIDWGVNTASSQPPLMPRYRVGVVTWRVNAAKIE